MYRCVSSLRQTAAFGLLLLVQLQQRVASRNVPMSAQDVKTASNLLRGVSARDDKWSPVLEERLLVNREALTPHITRMLNKSGIESTEMRAYQVINYLVTHPGATASELDFGVRTLGAALACQINKTVAVHVFFALEYAKRPLTLVPNIRWCMSKIQMALPGFLDKLSVFEQPIGHLLELNDHINIAFNSHDANNAVDKEEFVAHLRDAQVPVKKHLSVRCAGYTSELDIVNTVQVSSFTEVVFENYDEVNEQQLLEMIEQVNEYQYVDVVTGMRDLDFWTDRLQIKQYKLNVSRIIDIEGVEDEDEY